MSVPRLRFPGFAGEWEEKRIAEVGDVITGSTPDTSVAEYYGGSRLFVSPADIDEEGTSVSSSIKGLTEEGFLRTRKIRAGASLFVCIGSTIGKVALSLHECATNQQINAVVPSPKFSDNFVYYALRKKSRKIRELTAVQAVPIINKSTFANEHLSTPTLPEQKKIAAFLGVVDARIAALRARVLGLETYKRGLMQALFSQRLRFTKPDGTAFPDWEEKRLGEVATRCKAKNANLEYMRVLTNSAVQGVVDQGSYFDKDIANAENLGGYYIVKKGDFVYNPRISVTAPVGPIKRNDLGDGVMSPLYTVFRFNETNSDFYNTFFETTFWHDYMKSVANYGARHDRMAISMGDFMDMPLPFPHPDEQAKIAGALSAMDAKIAAVQVQVDKMQDFKKGLLQQMFV